MRLPARYLLIATAAAAALLATIAVRADTWPLELKRRETANPQVFDRTSYMLWTTSPQHFFIQVMNQGDGRVVFPGNQEQVKAFARIVKKEPKYVCEHPFRGVAKLGSQEYAFALDWVPAKPETKDGKPDREKAKPEAKKAEADSPTAKLYGAIAKATATSAKPLKVMNYNRLYFDLNHNGDLTDDKVIKVVGKTGRTLPNASYTQFYFPRVDLTIDVAGTKLAYSFLLSGYGYVGPQVSYTTVALSAAVRREGDITLAGKKHHVILLDFNSNGRFDDEIKISKNIRAASGALYPEQGDMLLVDPETAQMDSPYDVTGGTTRHYVSKMIDIDNRLYDVKISPAGDKLTLTPSHVSMGRVTNPSDSFRAVIYGERGFLAIHGTKGTPVAVPEGRWKLLSYTIEQKDRPEPAKPAGRVSADKEEPVKDARSWQAQAAAVLKLLGGTGDVSQVPRFGRGDAIVSAQATEKYPAVEVKKGKTVALPFGAPFKPTVTLPPYYRVGQEQLYLEMSLVGSAGEICTNLMVGGGRPPRPDFTITDPKGKVVQQGSFEYG